AFTLLAAGTEPERLALCRELAVGAGGAGMVAGQVLDTAEDRPAEEGYVTRMHRLKTGALIRASCRMGVHAGRGGAAALAAAEAYGDAVGLAFQVADDLLDVLSTPEQLGKPTGADAAAGRFTYPALLGVDGARAFARAQVARACEAVRSVEPAPGPLWALAHYAVERAV
ncbi:MAG: polyprenyl synthetase family protein, partial [Deltaproteobacteria bacterium]|nr:polyprenyl synthetase family protein [Deltaproteobacteria bacterium]